MAEKSRVILYEELRREIEKMDQYSFEEDVHASEKPASIKKTTLTLSLEELSKEKEKQEAKDLKKNTKKLFQKKRASTNVVKRVIIALSILLGLIIVALTAILIKEVFLK